MAAVTTTVMEKDGSKALVMEVVVEVAVVEEETMAGVMVEVPFPELFHSAILVD